MPPPPPRLKPAVVELILRQEVAEMGLDVADGLAPLMKSGTSAAQKTARALVDSFARALAPIKNRLRNRTGTFQRQLEALHKQARALSKEAPDEGRDRAALARFWREMAAYARTLPRPSSEAETQPVPVGLMASYKGANYSVSVGDDLVEIELGWPIIALDPLAGETGYWAVMTAHNPRSEKKTPKWNRTALARLRERVEVLEGRVRPAAGRSPDGEWEEESFFVTGLIESQVRWLAREFEQISFVAASGPGVNAELVFAGPMPLKEP